MRSARDDHSTLDRGHYEGIQKPLGSQLKRGGVVVVAQGDVRDDGCEARRNEWCVWLGDDRIMLFCRR